jgi:5-methyltetrahydrofolate corrinoid/iron sulfur protein methyltransferase
MIPVADNLHIMNPRVAKALRERDPSPLKKIAERCKKSNAYAMDINLGPMKHNGEETIIFVIEAVQDIFKGRLLLDSVQPEVIEAGIRACTYPPIINGFSMEDAKLEAILPLAAKYHTEIIGFLIDHSGQVPLRADERLALASELVARAQEKGVSIEHIIIDPVLAPLSWQEGTRYNREFLEVLHLLPQLFTSPPRTIAGLSNLGAGAPDRTSRIAVESAFIHFLAAAKLDYILMNVTQDSYLSALSHSQLLLGEKVFAWQEVKNSAEK